MALPGTGTLRAGAPDGPGKWVARVSPAWPLSKDSGQRKGLLPAPSIGEERAYLVTAETQNGCLALTLTFFCKANSKPDKPFQQGSEKEETCTREQASRDRCLQKMQGTCPLKDARTLLWLGGTPWPGFP